jgi:C4-dicarboxylate transporter, DctM subunit
MTPVTIGLIGIIVLIVLLLLRIPVSFVMLLVGFVGFSLVNSVDGALTVLSKDFWGIFSSYNLGTLPMFIFMGTIAFYSEISGRLYNVAYKFLGHFRGGLAIATTFACAAFGAVCASTIAGAAAMGKVTLPEMDKYGYDKALATGCVAAAGSLAIMIPPSGTLIVYGSIVEASIGKLFAAGILPGVVLTILFALTIFIMCRIKPGLAPAGRKSSWMERFKSLNGVIEMLLLFALVMGGMFVGWFTPTEAGAIGAAGAIAIALARRSLSWNGFRTALGETTRISVMVFLILAGATVFGRFMAISRIPFVLSEYIGTLGISPNIIMVFIIIAYFFAGCFMDSLAMITLTVPILYGVVTGLGFDPIWFGIIIVLVVEMGAITPPVGINVFTIKGVAPDVPMGTIFRGIWPFLGAEMVCTALVVLFPQIVLFLPSLITY